MSNLFTGELITDIDPSTVLAILPDKAPATTADRVDHGDDHKRLVELGRCLAVLDRVGGNGGPETPVAHMTESLFAAQSTHYILGGRRKIGRHGLVLAAWCAGDHGWCERKGKAVRHWRRWALVLFFLVVVKHKHGRTDSVGSLVRCQWIKGERVVEVGEAVHAAKACVAVVAVAAVVAAVSWVAHCHDAHHLVGLYEKKRSRERDGGGRERKGVEKEMCVCVFVLV